MQSHDLLDAKVMRYNLNSGQSMRELVRKPII